MNKFELIKTFNDFEKINVDGKGNFTIHMKDGGKIKATVAELREYVKRLTTIAAVIVNPSTDLGMYEAMLDLVDGRLRDE